MNMPIIRIYGKILVIVLCIPESCDDHVYPVFISVKTVFCIYAQLLRLTISIMCYTYLKGLFFEDHFIKALSVHIGPAVLEELFFIA